MSRAADTLSAFVNFEANSLPEGFPKNSVTATCAVLRELPSGTVGGAVVVLEHVFLRLADWNASYLPLLMGSEETDFEASQRFIDREGGLSQRLELLTAAAVTALSTYRHEFGAAPAELPSKEPPIKPSRDLASVIQQTFNSAREVQVAGGGLIEKLQDDDNRRKLENEERARHFERVCKDSINLAIIAEIESSEKKLHVHYFDRISLGLSSTKRILGRLLDPAITAAEQWIQSDLSGLADKVEILSDLVRKTASILKRPKNKEADFNSMGGGGARREFKHVSGTWRDRPFDIEICHQLIIRREFLPRQWRPKVEILNFPRYTARYTPIDLLYIHDLYNVRAINLSGMRVINQNYADRLLRLQTLILDYTNVSSLDFVNGMEGLETLSLRGCRLGSLEPLKNCFGLKQLDVDGAELPRSALEPILSRRGLKIKGYKSLRN